MPSCSTLTDKKTCIEFVKFSLVGCINTGLQYGVFYVLYAVCGVYYLTASAIGYCVGMANSFLLNKTWTFHSFRGKIKLEFPRFVIVNLVALGVNLGALKTIVVGFKIPPEYGQVIAMIFSTITNFLGNKFWTFR